MENVKRSISAPFGQGDQVSLSGAKLIGIFPHLNNESEIKIIL